MIRKMLHNTLHANTAKSYIPYQILENQRMLIDFLDTPDRFIAHIRRFTHSLSTQMIFGFRTIDVDDPKLLRLNEVCDCVLPCAKWLEANILNCKQNFAKWASASGLATAALLDIYPILRYLPDICVPLRPYAKALHKSEEELYLDLWMNVKTAVKDGTAKVSRTLSFKPPAIQNHLTPFSI